MAAPPFVPTVSQVDLSTRNLRADSLLRVFDADEGASGAFAQRFRRIRLRKVNLYGLMKPAPSAWRSPNGCVSRPMERDADSLEATIQTRNRPGSLPVFTIGSVAHLRASREYADRVIDKLLDSLLRIETLRGTGRLFLP
jgi:hypothetical protein